jgi:hypothetical protein
VLQAAFVQFEKDEQAPVAVALQVVPVIWKRPQAVDRGLWFGFAILNGGVLGTPELSVSAMQDMTLACDAVKPALCRTVTLQ